MGGVFASGTPDGPLFVGRAEQLEEIEQATSEARDAHPRVVWIEGVAGSGKTALVREALRRLPGEFQVVSAPAYELASEIPFELASRLARSAAETPFAMSMELLTSWSQHQDDGPLAVVVEDLHWADPSSRLSLLAAAMRLERDRIVLIVTSRPGHPDDGWERLVLDEERGRLVLLGGLRVEQVAILAAAGGVPLSPAEAERLHRHTAGHALYVRTLLTELTPEQLRSSAGDLPAPRSLASATIAALAELPSRSRDLAAAMAVLNQPLPLSLVGRVAGVEAPVEPFERLLATRFVQWEPDSPGTPVEFTHPLQRSAVAQDLSPTRRRDLHRAAAGVLTGAAALPHRVAAADGTDDVLADELDSVASNELERRSAGLAARHLLWASSLTSDPKRCETRLLEAVRALLLDKQSTQAKALRDRAEACAPSTLRSLVLGLVDWEQGDSAGAEKWLSEAAAVGAGPEGPLAARAWAELSEIAIAQDRHEDAVVAAGHAIDLADAGSMAQRLAWGLKAIGVAMRYGSAAGLRELEPFLPGKAENVKHEYADLLVMRAMLRMYGGKVAEAIADTEAVLHLARRGSSPVQIVRAHYQLSNLLLTTGNWDEALLNSRVGLSLAFDEGLHSMRAQCHALIATVAAHRGQWEAATDELEQAENSASRQSGLEAVATARIASAFLAQEQRRHSDVVAALIDLPKLVPMIAGLNFWPALVVSLIDSGNLDEASRQVEELAKAASERELEFASRLAGLRARLASARGDKAETSRQFEAAMASWRPDDPYLERALLLHSYGRFLLATGERRQATDQLRVARELLAAVGAEPALAAVDSDLEEAGLRAPAGAARSSLDLTDRERDVATLVSKGLSNPEVAAQLYVSRKAVEYHLGNIFSKLGIRSRGELRSIQV